jgi:hypothetical protein
MSVKELKSHIERTRAAAVASEGRRRESQEAARKQKAQLIHESLVRQTDAIAAMLLKALQSGRKSVSHTELATTFLKGHEFEDTYQNHELHELFQGWLIVSELDSHFKSSTPDYDSWGIILKE